MSRRVHHRRASLPDVDPSVQPASPPARDRAHPLIAEGQYTLQVVHHEPVWREQFGRYELQLILEVVGAGAYDGVRVVWYGPLGKSLRRRPGDSSKVMLLWVRMTGRRLARGERLAWSFLDAHPLVRGSVRTVRDSWEREVGADGRWRRLPRPEALRYSVCESISGPAERRP
jgi:hypothetical protein